MPLYHGFQAQADLLWPLRLAAAWTVQGLGPSPPPAWRPLGAALEMLAFVQVTHRRPDYGITEVIAGGRPVAVREEPVLRTPFGTLLRFAKEGVERQPPLLIAAPMSGHFATLLRDTVRTALADHEVYITDWHNARDVPLWAGRFDLDAYIAHLIDFLAHIGPGANLLAICQPSPAALAATALMAEDGHPATPRTLTLMAGPIDCRVQPTRVNELAKERPIGWFERNLISRVPMRLPGAMRRVYPGFVQLCAFMSMNLERHVQTLRQMREQLAEGDREAAEPTRRFYEEYFAVADLPAEFYLDTVHQVFQEHALARGALQWRGRPVRPSAIRRTALLTVEGERDDICSVGQTLAAHALCDHLPPTLKDHYVQPGVGHYGVFSGRRWSGQIYPLLRDLTHRWRH